MVFKDFGVRSVEDTVRRAIGRGTVSRRAASPRLPSRLTTRPRGSDVSPRPAPAPAKRPVGTCPPGMTLYAAGTRSEKCVPISCKSGQLLIDGRCEWLSTPAVQPPPAPPPTSTPLPITALPVPDDTTLPLVLPPTSPPSSSGATMMQPLKPLTPAAPAAAPAAKPAPPPELIEAAAAVQAEKLTPATIKKPSKLGIGVGAVIGLLVGGPIGAAAGAAAGALIKR